MALSGCRREPGTFCDGVVSSDANRMVNNPHKAEVANQRGLLFAVQNGVA
jgi:hypothetical protein